MLLARLTGSRPGRPRGRPRVFRRPLRRDGQAAVRVAQVGSALATGVLDALRHPRSTARLTELLGATDAAPLEAHLRTLVEAGLVRTADGVHRLSHRGVAVLDDDVVRAAYEGFSGYHTGLYRDLGAQLRGSPERDDVTTRGDVVARLSRAMSPFLHEALVGEVRRVAPSRVLDGGCGDGGNLVEMLRGAGGDAGLTVDSTRRVSPGEPLHAVVARR